MSSTCTNPESTTRQAFLIWTTDFVRRRNKFQRNYIIKLAARKVKLAKEKARLRLWKIEVDQEYERLYNELFKTTQQLRNDNKVLRATFVDMTSKCVQLSQETKHIRLSLERKTMIRDRVVPDCDQFDSEFMD